MEYKNLNPLNKITKIIKRGITPKYTANKRINVINQRCIRDGRIDFSPVRFHDDSKKIQEDKILQNYDVLVNSTGVGTLGRVAQFKNISDKIYTVDSHVTILRPIDEIDKIYFGYAIKNKEPFITKMGEGSTGQTELSRDRLGEEVIINVPTLEIQKSIASIMYSLDKKIEVNEKIISNLEEQAQAIFKSWFVDFEPFQDGNFVESELGMIPEGWKVSITGKEFDIEYGKNLPTKNLLKNGYPVYGGNGQIGFYNKYLYSKPRLLVSCRGAASGKVGLSKAYSFVTNNSLVFNEKIDEYFYYYKYLFNNIVFENYVTGSAQPQLTIKNSTNIRILIPNKNIISNFNKLVEANFKKQNVLDKENKKLAEIRDALLPRLMSGEIDVSNIKIKGEEVKNE